MRSTLMFARKEALEILRTSRIIVLPAILLLFALTGPLLAKYTPEILSAVAGDQLGGIELPPPTAFDAYGQWVKNLAQIGLFAVIISYGGIVSAERRRGTAILALIKPLSRTGFVLAKFVVHAVFLSVLLAVMTAVTWGVTAAVFGEAPPGPLWASAMCWLLLALVYLSLVTLFSVLLPSAAGAAGLGIAAFAALSVAGIWRPLAEHSPAGLSSAAAMLAAGVETFPLASPILISLACIVLAVLGAAAIFRRQEL